MEETAPVAVLMGTVVPAVKVCSYLAYIYDKYDNLIQVAG